MNHGHGTTPPRFPPLAALLLALALLAPAGAAQTTPLPGGAADALARGEAAMTEAIDAYPVGYPDRPLWREAIRAGRDAVRLAPGRPEPLRFLAEALSRSNWTGPAWEAWLDYLATGESLDAEAGGLFSAVGGEHGYDLYRRGDAEGALAVYRRIAQEVPFDLEAQVWTGRILLETGRPAEAAPYWRTVAERDPDDARARYFLALAEDRARWGEAAADRFRAGVAAYEAGRLQAALADFRAAADANPDYAAAWAWRGRVAFELEDFAAAERWYREAVALEPGNATYDYFAAESERRVEDAAPAPDEEDAAPEEAPAGD